MSDESDFPAYFHFRHPLVRDLCWTLAPEFDLLAQLPPYQRFTPSQPAVMLRQWLELLDKDPRPLEDFFNDGARRRLGHHFERLILFYLSYAPAAACQVLAHNQRIYEQNAAGHRVTVGELDFLLCQGAQTLHLETAVKFFLGVENAGEVRWLGPGLRDRLDRKIRHLREHQLPISQRIESETTGRIIRAFWLKGVLFHPWGQHLPLDEGLLDQTAANQWLTCAQALEMPDIDAWVCLPKSHWLGCGWESLAEQTATQERIIAHFAQGDRVLMLSHRTSAARRLVVPDLWPAEARAALAEP